MKFNLTFLLSKDSEGYWITYEQAKQRGEVKNNRFLVPITQCTAASCVDEYLKLLLKFVPDIKDTDDLFKTCTMRGLSRSPMGKNYLANIGKDIAKKLNLGDTDLYTGHCFRRSSATAAANAGANSMELKRHFGWVQETTALRYLDETNDRARKMAKLLTEENKENSINIQCNSQQKNMQFVNGNDKKVYNFEFHNSNNITLNFQ